MMKRLFGSTMFILFVVAVLSKNEDASKNKKQETQPDDCSICLDILKSRPDNVVVPCPGQHEYHFDCLHLHFETQQRNRNQRNEEHRDFGNWHLIEGPYIKCPLCNELIHDDEWPTNRYGNNFRYRGNLDDPIQSLTTSRLTDIQNNNVNNDNPLDIDENRIDRNDVDNNQDQVIDVDNNQNDVDNNFNRYQFHFNNHGNLDVNNHNQGNSNNRSNFDVNNSNQLNSNNRDNPDVNLIYQSNFNNRDDLDDNNGSNVINNNNNGFSNINNNDHFVEEPEHHIIPSNNNGYSENGRYNASKKKGLSKNQIIIIAVCASVGLLLTVGIILLVIAIRHHRKHPQLTMKPSNPQMPTVHENKVMKIGEEVSTPSEDNV